MYGCIGVIFTWIVCFDSKFSCGKIESKNQKLGYFNCREKKCRIKEKKKKNLDEFAVEEPFHLLTDRDDNYIILRNYVTRRFESCLFEEINPIREN